jgi:hypothetical protein
MAQSEMLIIGIGAIAVGAYAYFTGMLCRPFNLCPSSATGVEIAGHNYPYPAGGRSPNVVAARHGGYGDDGYGDDYDFESSAAQISVA